MKLGLNQTFCLTVLTPFIVATVHILSESRNSAASRILTFSCCEISVWIGTGAGKGSGEKVNGGEGGGDGGGGAKLVMNVSAGSILSIFIRGRWSVLSTSIRQSSSQ